MEQRKISAKEAKHIAVSYALGWVTLLASSITEDYYDEIPPHHMIEGKDDICTESGVYDPKFKWCNASEENRLTLQKEFTKLATKLIKFKPTT